MLALLGDNHGWPEGLEALANAAARRGASCLIQLGDFGVHPRLMPDFMQAARNSPIPIYFFDGNHEHFPTITSWVNTMGNDSIYTVVPGKLFYVRRGSVLEIDGRKVAVLGGAGSIDFKYRTLGVDWFLEEQISDTDVARLDGVDKVDLLLTHTPPQSVITANFDIPRSRAIAVRQMFGAPEDWFDPSAGKVEAVWKRLGNPPLYCGHMHKTVVDRTCTILNINELAYR